MHLNRITVYKLKTFDMICLAIMTDLKQFDKSTFQLLQTSFLEMEMIKQRIRESEFLIETMHD